MNVEFELLDGYLLDATPAKDEVVRRLLAAPSASRTASPFYEGMRLLGNRTPDLSLMALRLVLAGKHADDEAVTRLRALVERVRGGDRAARDEYRGMLD